MPKNRPSNCIRCPYGDGRYFQRRFVEHLMANHGLTMVEAQDLKDRAVFPPIDAKGYYRAAEVQGTIPAARIGNSSVELKAPAIPEPMEKPLEKMTRAELIAKLEEERTNAAM